MFKDFYKILEIPFSASPLEIKKSYRKLALKYHPDTTSGNKSLEEKFKEVQTAYETLSKEEKRKSYDIKYKDHYKLWDGQKENHEPKKEQQSTEGERSKITPQIILDRFKSFSEAINSHQRQSLNQQTFISNLRILLSEQNIGILRYYDDIAINKKIIHLALISCKKLDYSYNNEIITILVKIAGTDNEILKIIFEFAKKGKFNNYIKTTVNYCARNYKALIVIGLILAAIISSLFQPNENKSISRPLSGDLYSDTNKNKTNPSQQDSNVKVAENKKQVDYSDWSATNYSTGNSPSCFNFKPRFDKSLNNRLEIRVGSNTDAVVKLINVENDKSIRYSYIRSEDTYIMRHIPQGKYYVKIAYGRDWRQKIDENKCKGKFIINPLYKKGNEILDFNKIYDGIKTVDGEQYRNYKIPSYSLKLDVIASDTSSQFQTNAISEDDFNN